MEFALRMTGKQHDAMKSHLFPDDGNEAVVIALCGRRAGDDRHVLMMYQMVPIPYEQCQLRTSDRVTWLTDLIEPLLKKAEKMGMAILKIHSHPNGYEYFSDVDNVADRELFPSIYSWIDDNQPHMSAIMLPDGRITARVVTRQGDFQPVQLVAVAGDDLHFFWHSSLEHKAGPKAFDAKNSQFFGDATYARLRNLSVAVVGCSGTGSPLIEQLARLGIGQLTLVDPDVVKDKNLNRIINATREDANAECAKVDVLADAIRRMDLGTTLHSIRKNLLDGTVLRSVAGCDVLFGCMDSAEGRYYLNRIATFYSIPYFDLGVNLEADGKGGVSVVCCSVHYLQPDRSSLVGRGMISMETVRAEGLARRNPEQYAQQRREGYIHNVEVERPAVITINMFVAAIAANEFIARVHGYRRTGNAESAIRTFDFRENDHTCHADCCPCPLLAHYSGRGDMRPFMDDPSPEIQA